MKARGLALAAAAAGAAVGGALVVGARRWRAVTAETVARLRAAAGASASAARVYREADVAGLPAPVRRYFAYALRDGQPLITYARLEQRGTFRMSAREDSWRPFEAVEHFVPAAPGFVWDARIAVLPGAAVRVRDSYVDGSGRMRADLLSLVPIVDGYGRAFDEGALCRYLAEAPWFPTALLPASGVSWAPIDDTHARATLTAPGVSVSIEVEVDGDGRIVSVFAPWRPRDVKGRAVPTPWGGVFRDYDERQGMRVPTAGVVRWWIDGREYPYWRGTATAFTFEFARDAGAT